MSQMDTSLPSAIEGLGPASFESLFAEERDRLCSALWLITRPGDAARGGAAVARYPRLPGVDPVSKATPELRAAMLRVLAKVPMVQVELGVSDPTGRPANVLRFHAYDADVEVFADSTTGDFMAMTEGGTTTIIVESAGIVGDDHSRPGGEEQTVSPAS